MRSQYIKAQNNISEDNLTSNLENHHDFNQEAQRLLQEQSIFVQLSKHQKQSSNHSLQNKGGSKPSQTSTTFLDSLQLTKTKSCENSQKYVELASNNPRRINSQDIYQQQLPESSANNLIEMTIQLSNIGPEQAVKKLNSESEYCSNVFAEKNSIMGVIYEIRVRLYPYQYKAKLIKAILDWCKDKSNEKEFKFKKKNVCVEGNIACIFELRFNRNCL